MRNVEAHLLADKMDEAVTQYINSHQASEPVHIDTNGIPMTVQDDGAGRVTVMHQQTYTTQMCRQVSVTEQVGEGPWGEELLEGPIAAIVAHLQNSRHHPPHHKVAQVRSDIDTSVILDGSMRFSGQALEQQAEPVVVQLPPMQTLPPLQDMKRCSETDWFSDKNKKQDPSMLQDSDSQVLEMGASSSPAQHKQQSRKSLPHKKRISRKLKRNGNSTPQQELVVINCSPVHAPPEQEQILPDNFVTVPHAHHISHEVRPMFICQICGEYYGEEQLKFYHHLKQHYEPHATIIIENPVPDLAMDKMTNNCIVDNVATLPDSIVELSLENTVPKTMYQPIDKHILYTSSDKTLTYNSNKLQYSMASVDKEPTVPTAEAEKSDLYETLDKLELYNCGKCSKTFRKQKQCEAHVREAHSTNTKLEDMGEFSEPEDLMAGIQVCVGDEPYEQSLLPHLTVENGHVHQEHTRHWYGRGGAGCAGYCGVCAREPDAAPLKLLKEEVLQRIFDSEVSDNANFADNMMPDHDVADQDQDPDHDHDLQQQQDHGHSHDHEQTHEHRHGHIEHSHRHDHGENEHIHRHNEHDPEFSQRGHRHNENSHRHNGHDYRHNEHSHELNEDDHGNNEHGHDHNESSHMHNDHDHGHSDHDRGHSEHGHRFNGHDHRLNEHSHKHNENEDNEHSHGHILKQEVIRKEELDPYDAKGKQFSCPSCERVFGHRNSLLYHALSHSGKHHLCRDCGKGFYTLGALKIHKRTHSGDRPYKCDVCGREFRQWSDLKYHKISLHSEKKHFKCEFCGKEFARKYSLNVHVRIHTGEKNYKCDFCTKTFRASSYRLAHMRTHTDDRPFKCTMCEKSFRSGFDLRRHMMVHDKTRLRLDEHKSNAKDTKKTKMIDTKEEKVEPPPKKIKQIALASTTKPPVMKKAQKTKKASKKGAPNVTVQNRDVQFKINNEYTNNVEVYDNRPEYAKLKYVYSDSDKFKTVYSDSDKFKTMYSDSDKFKTVYSESDSPFKSQIVFKDQTPQRDLAVLRPMFRGPNLDSVETEKVPYRTENTDGKMHVFTRVEKAKEYNGSIVSNTQVLGDIRHLEREVAREVRSEISGEGIETGFLERLTAIYNIPAV